MKILIAISSKKYSSQTLEVGMRVAKAFNAKPTIVDVGDKINQFSLKEVGVAQERMESWDLDRPGVEVLEWAFDFLSENKLIEKKEIESGFPKNTLIETGGRRSEVYLKGTVCDDVSLILRNGEIIEELISEVQKEHYDVTIIGKSQSSKKDYELSQYIDSSIFIVNNYQLDRNYKILLAIHESYFTKKAVKYSVRIAQAFDIGVNIIVIGKNNESTDGLKKAGKWSAKFLQRNKISFSQSFEVGDPIEIINKKADKNHILIMSPESNNPIKTFFKGNAPLKILKQTQSSVLIVK